MERLWKLSSQTVEERKETMTREGMAVPHTVLCEKLISDGNLFEAAKKVQANGGAPGIDGMKASEAVKYIQANKEKIAGEIIARKYKPSPVKRVEIPKDNGKVRLLGIPTVRDRIVQQALVQVLTPVFEPTFSEHSYGYRPKRSAEDAVRLAQAYMAEGHEWVVDLDMSKFFDTVDHDILMGFVDRELEDKDLRRLIYVFLKAGVLVNGQKEKTPLGVPQGGPLSPLLANIYLTPFDKEMERRGRKFVRYADDIILFTKSEWAARRVLINTTRYLEKKLKLKVNGEKSSARPAKGSDFLGFTFQTTRGEEGARGRCVPKDGKKEKLKAELKELTKRNRGVSLERVIREVNQTMKGWLAYYARASLTRWLSRELLPWLRRRIRQYMWKLWKTAKNRKRQMRKAGVEEWRIQRFKSWSNRNWWAMAKAIHCLINNKLLVTYYKLDDFEARYRYWHQRRKAKDDELDKYEYLVRQYEEEQEMRLLADLGDSLCW